MCFVLVVVCSILVDVCSILVVLCSILVVLCSILVVLCSILVVLCSILVVGRDRNEAPPDGDNVPSEGHAVRCRGDGAASCQQTPDVGGAGTLRDETGAEPAPGRDEELHQSEHEDGATTEHGEESGLSYNKLRAHWEKPSLNVMH